MREEKSFSQRAFSIYTDIRKLQDKAKTSYTLSTRRLRFGYEQQFSRSTPGACFGVVRKEIPELEKLVQVGRKKFVRYEEGAQLYSMGLHTFQELAKDAKAVYHVKRVVLVNTEIVDEYLENFRDEL